MQLRQLSPLSRFKSFKCAVRGVAGVVRTQPNVLLIAPATVVVAAAGFYFRLARIEWCFILSAILAVWAAETVNTALESLTDLVSPEYHPLAGKAKDTAAGGVLLAVVYALCIAALVFGPRLLN